jgi:hypothetical protein
MVMIPTSLPRLSTTGRRSTLLEYMISRAFSAVISSSAVIGFFVMIAVIFSFLRLVPMARISRRLTIPMIFPLPITGSPPMLYWFSSCSASVTVAVSSTNRTSRSISSSARLTMLTS